MLTDSWGWSQISSALQDGTVQAEPGSFIVTASAEDSLVVALSLVHCSSFTLAHPRSQPYLLESECYNSFAARGAGGAGR